MSEPSNEANFIDTIFAQLGKKGDRPLCTEMHGKEPRPTTGMSLVRMIGAIRGALRSRGAAQGDRVVLLAPNSTNWVAADLAMLAEGIISVPLYVRQKDSEVLTIIEDCGAKTVLVADETQQEVLAKSLAGKPISVVRLAELLQHEAVDEPPLGAAPDQVMTLVYTSGTSGAAKGVQLTRAGIDYMLTRTSAALSELLSESGLRQLGGRTDQDAIAADSHRIFHYLPFCFAGSRMVLWTALIQGSGLSMSTDLNTLKDELGAAKPHYLLNVPMLLERMKRTIDERVKGRGKIIANLYEQGITLALREREHGSSSLKASERMVLATARKVLLDKIRQGIGPNLRCLICGSAPLAETTQRYFQAIGLPVLQVYGLTETTAIVSMDKPGQVRPGFVGLPLDGCEISVSEEDELLVRGPHVFPGYWNKPQETTDALAKGWFHTGDRVTRDEKGRLQILGRLKDVIVTENGHNVVPGPIEDALCAKLSNAEHLVVLGHGRPYPVLLATGELSDASVSAALEEVNGDLPHYARVRTHRVLSERFTIENELLTANQKVRRRAVEKRFQSEIDELYGSSSGATSKHKGQQANLA